MWVVLIVLVVVAATLGSTLWAVRRRDYRRAHPTVEAQQRELRRAYSMSEMTAEEYEEQVAKLLAPNQINRR